MGRSEARIERGYRDVATGGGERRLKMTATRPRAIDIEAHAWATLATPEAPPTPRSPNDGACSPGPQPRIARLDPRHEGEFVHLLLALDMPSRVSRFMYAAGDDSLIEHGRRALSNAAWLAGAFVDGSKPS